MSLSPMNYTCAPGSTSPPVAVGAVAKLLDVGPLLPLFPPSNSQTLLNQIPAYLLSFDLSAMPDSTLPHLGTHYFDAAKVPTFDLGATGKLKGKKGASIAAPKDACKGTYGAVDWLQLTEAEGSVGLKLGYRVYTAGGKAPPSCAGQKENIEVQYAAQYWFFGPPSP
ncbi:MAG: hypothetical protein LQ342_007503 [Letrouitia transgressa]|nr:MAG: hypothetical protein LQ342_007503 [Letrouitia transgressa]